MWPLTTSLDMNTKYRTMVYNGVVDFQVKEYTFNDQMISLQSLN